MELKTKKIRFVATPEVGMVSILTECASIVVVTKLENIIIKDEKIINSIFIKSDDSHISVSDFTELEVEEIRKFLRSVAVLKALIPEGHAE